MTEDMFQDVVVNGVRVIRFDKSAQNNYDGSIKAGDPVSFVLWFTPLFPSAVSTGL